MHLRSLATFACGSAALLSALLMFAACTSLATAPPAPATTAQESPIATQEPISEPSSWREEACKSYIDIDLQKAHDRYEYPVFWTFQTNFYDPQVAGQTDLRLGCLRFYWRDDTAGHEAFTGTLNSAVVVECQAIGIVQTHDISTSSMPLNSSSGSRHFGDPTLPAHKSMFEPGAYVECPLNISGSLAELRNTEAYTLEMASLPLAVSASASQAVTDMLNNPMQKYSAFAAAAVVDPITDGILDATPLVFYEPQEGGDMTADMKSESEVELSLDHNLEKTHNIFEGLLAGTYTNSDMSISAPQDCTVPQMQFYVWLDFGQCNKDAGACASGTSGTPEADQTGPYLQFQSWLTEANKPNICKIPQSAITTDRVPFWIGPSIVYFGYNPVTHETFTQPLNLYEGWVDPDSAVHPGG